MTDIKKKFGNRLKNLRKKRGLSQEEVSNKAGLDRTYEGKIERGERSPSLETVEKIAEALDVDIKALFDFGD